MEASATRHDVSREGKAQPLDNKRKVQKEVKMLNNLCHLYFLLLNEFLRRRMRDNRDFEEGGGFRRGRMRWILQEVKDLAYLQY